MVQLSPQGMSQTGCKPSPSERETGKALRCHPNPRCHALQRPVASPPPGSTPPQAPYAQLGSLLKKRYPAAEEIEVIGGYLSLAKSCLSKTGSMGKKLKISFNESSLHSTYEYPSESSAWDSGDEDDDEKLDEKLPDEQTKYSEQDQQLLLHLKERLQQNCII
uniref:Phostensin/Taperin PP1-binding domain-containing protein n=1 Tax=Sander lucioperca TaxID=283035 RepID=A0A8D0A946_SANLU